MKAPTPGRLRFWSRSILLTFTALAVCLGFMANQVREQRNAMNSVRRLDGLAFHDLNYRHPGLRERLAEIIGPDFVAGVSHLTLDNPATKDEDLAIIRRLQGIKQVDLRGTKVTNVGLRHLENLITIERLEIDSENVTDDAVGSLRTLKGLISLWLIGTQLTDVGISDLQQALPAVFVTRSQNDGMADPAAAP